jgi:hypothetical protein
MDNYLKKNFIDHIFNKTNNTIEDNYISDNYFFNPELNYNKKYFIYDDLLSKKQINDINLFCKEYQMIFLQKSISQKHKKELLNKYELYKNHWNKSISYLFFKIECINNNYMYNLFYESILPNLDCIKNKKNIIISRCYINSHTLGFPGSWHRDGKPVFNINTEKNAFTVLLFINNNWNINFDGQTSFLLNDTNKDSIEYIHCKPGRIVVFHPHITHKACEISPYSLQTNRLRFVMAYHLHYAL